MNDAKRTLHRLRLKVRRKFRKQKRQVEDITLQADDSLDKHVFRRMGRLYRVRRFVAAWTALVLMIGIGAVWQVRGLDDYYLAPEPASGGVYREGVLGTFTTANPLFAVTNVDASVSRLVFDSLFVASPLGELEPNLATALQVDDSGLVYTVKLRGDVRWHDGEIFDAEDVLFTYQSIQNPETRSPLQSSWDGVKVAMVDSYTVTFTLPNILSSFQYSLVNGIAPEHILGLLDPEDLRSATFNTVDTVGTGQMLYESVEVLGTDIDDRQEKVTLKSNEQYHGPKTQIDGVVIRAYRLEESMLKAFEDKEIVSMVGLDTISDTVSDREDVQTYSTSVSSAVMLFLNNSSEGLNDKKVRQALVHATDTNELRRSLGFPLLPVDSPFLQSHFTYDEKQVQLAYSPEKAIKILDEAGWKLADDGKRYKEDIPLQFRLVSQSLSEYATIVQKLQAEWAELGITVDAVLQPEQDIQSGAIARHDYDILLYGISLGPDPDVFAFWHSSQADPRQRTRLNLSEYRSEVADEALEGGRTRLNEDLRKVKYEPFTKAWRSDAPAIGLYQPRFLFVVQGTFEGYQEGQFNNPTDRFYSIAEWKIRQEKTIRQE